MNSTPQLNTNRTFRDEMVAELPTPYQPPGFSPRTVVSASAVRAPNTPRAKAQRLSSIAVHGELSDPQRVINAGPRDQSPSPDIAGIAK